MHFAQDFSPKHNAKIGIIIYLTKFFLKKVFVREKFIKKVVLQNDNMAGRKGACPSSPSKNLNTFQIFWADF